MAFRCPHCGAELDATLFEFRRLIRCRCGREIEAGHRLELEQRTAPDRSSREKDEE